MPDAYTQAMRAVHELSIAAPVITPAQIADISQAVYLLSIARQQAEAYEATADLESAPF